LGLAVVVDLRRPPERQRAPTPPQALANTDVLTSEIGQDEEPPHVAFLRETDLSESSVEQFFLHYYRNAPFEERHLALFQGYFAALSASPNPVLIHCTAGKDRTGLLAALTHHALGVGRDDILADYLLTNEAARLDARMEMVRENLAMQFNRQPSKGAVRGLLGVDAKYLEAAFAAITERSGSVDAYLDALGVDSQCAERILASVST